MACRANSPEEAAACSFAVQSHDDEVPSDDETDTVYRSLQRARKLQERKCQCLATLHPAVPDVVWFIVGGKQFALHRSLLEKDPQSLLFVLAEQHYTRQPRYPVGTRARSKRPRDGTAVCGGAPHDLGDSDRICIPDRDSVVFSMLLNLLRGYTSAILASCMEACKADMEYYGLHESWKKVFATPVPYSFTSTTHGTRLCSDQICSVASPPLLSGVHSIGFSVGRIPPQSGRVGVGVLGVTCEDGDPSDNSVDKSGKALYWSDGSVTVDMESSKVNEMTSPITESGIVRVELDAEERTVRWFLHEDHCVAMQRIPLGVCVAFCAVASGNAQVTIVAV